MKQINSYVWILSVLLILYILFHFLFFPDLGSEKALLEENQKQFVLNQFDSFHEKLNMDSTINYDSLLNIDYAVMDNYFSCCNSDSAFSENLKLAYKALEKENLELFLDEACWYKESIFWLDSKWILIEVLVWSLFGVFCSLLFHGSEAVRQNKFDPKEIAVHYAKLIYSPIITVIIIFSGNVLINDGAINVEGISYWVIVLSFILGFYSRRAIDLLDRIKDLIFRSSEAKKDEDELKLTLQGIVKFDSSIVRPPLKELSNATILVQSASGEFQSDILKPDSKGIFSLYGLSPDEYSVSVELVTSTKEYEAQTTLKLDENTADLANELILIEVTDNIDDGDDG
ncbi:hypothetical protein [Ekhidna sp.]|jgi:hypothetical protein|uniref:hypothetical protein n=1 Tax=Ekhidna sp. TaxID=2608089 RepID=UPI0032EEF2CB